MIRILTIIAIAALLVGCWKDEPQLRRKVVASLGDCTEGTGGYGGESAKCRATFTDGTRGTVYRPVDVGDVVACRGRYCWVQ